MNLAKINLNLLVVLDMLLREKHVTKASQKLYVTQSTVSAALNQLRDLFNDELLVREKNQMVLTPLAQKLAPKVSSALQQLQETVFNKIDFNPKTAKITFTLVMNDYLECLLLAELNAYLSANAPGIKFIIKHADTLHDELFIKNNPVHLGIGILTSKAQCLSHEKLFDEHFVCASSKNNSILKKPLTMKTYLAAEHLSLTDPEYSDLDVTDFALKQLGETRNIKLNVTHVSTAMYLLMNSSLLATAPMTLIQKAKTILNLAYQELPFAVPDITIHQVWHSQFDHDEAHQWLRKTIKTILQDKLEKVSKKS